MKSWLHNIAESYIHETPATRRDLKEHYSLLSEEEKFSLLSENALKYLDEQLKVAYGFGIGDLTEEELGFVLGNLFEATMSREEAVAKGIPTGPGTNYTDTGERPLTLPKKGNPEDYKDNWVHRTLRGALGLSSDGSAREIEPKTPPPPPTGEKAKTRQYPVKPSGPHTGAFFKSLSPKMQAKISPPGIKAR